MRSQNRSDHRPPDPPDDWVNGSWTVDCVCGVNFDDGEEMVNCDECGVWVHTRCSRYVKSEKLFACDKCKVNKKKRYCENDKIEEEEEEAETEVAQLLVDLPTKTLKRSLGNPNPNPNPTHGFPRRRLWTEIPREERVHVQGIPGGDASLFDGLGPSSVFSRELWKSTGYVPKKFNFPYNEFPSRNEGNGNLANSAVGNASFQVSLLGKDKVVLPTDPTSLGKVMFSTDSAILDGATKTQVEDSKKTKGEGEGQDVRSTPQNDMKKKDRSSIHPTVIHYGKLKEEDSQTSRDVIGKRKAKVVHVEGEDSKKRSAHASRSGDL